MKRKVHFFGIAGAVVLVFALISDALVVYDLFNFFWIHLSIGALLILFFLFRGGLSLLSSAAVKRKALFSLGMTTYSSLFVGVLILVNFIAYQHEIFRYDSTAYKIYTLAPQTKAMLDSLSHKIALRGFYVAGKVDKDVDDLARLMDRYSDKVEWSVVDPEKNPTLVEKYGIVEGGTVHLTLDVGNNGATRSSKISGKISEQDIVNSILKLTRAGKKVVYYLVGHGEPSLSDGKTTNGYLFFKESVEGDNLAVKELVLSQTKSIPRDAAAIIIAAPQKNLLEIEMGIIEDYLRAGGRAVFFHEPRRTRDIERLAKPFAIQVGRDVVVDEVQRMFSGPSLGVEPMVRQYGAHPITASLSEGAVFSIASSVRATSPISESEVFNVSELALTSKESWAEQNLDLIFSATPAAKREEGDLAGPISIASAAEFAPTLSVKSEERTAGRESKSQTETARNGRLVVFGDADFVSNANIRQLFNRDLVLNSLNWVIGEEEGITIRPRSLRESTKAISQEQLSAMFLLTGLLLPETLLLGGLGVWWKRKQ